MSTVKTHKLIEVRDVSHIYLTRKGRIFALESLFFDVLKGEFFVIVGRSGCGKSTLLKIIAGLLPSTGGEVRLDGKKVENPLDNIGIVFQSPILLKWRAVLENVLLPVNALGLSTKKYRHNALELLRLTGLEGFEDKYPRELSGGMQQRVAISRALVLDPALLLMDEPFGSIDAITREEMNEELLRIWREKRKTILFITHGISEAVFMADRILVMSPRPGKVVDIIPIDLPRPRTVETRASKEFGQYVVEIYKMIELDR